MTTTDDKFEASNGASVASKDVESEMHDTGAVHAAEEAATATEEVSQAVEVAPAPATDVQDAEFKELEAGADPTAVDLTDANTFAPVDGDPEHVDMIHDVCYTISYGQKQFLDTSKKLGKIIQSYIDAKGIEKVSDALKMITRDVSAASLGRLSHLKEDSLRKALKLHNALTEEQFELAKSLGFSLRNVQPLIGNNVTPEQRDEILQKVYEGKLKQTEISKEVKALNSPEDKQENRGGARKKTMTPLEFAQHFKANMDALLEEMEADYPEHTFKALRSADQDTKEEYAQFYEATSEQIEQFNRLWTENANMTKSILHK